MKIVTYISYDLKSARSDDNIMRHKVCEIFTYKWKAYTLAKFHHPLEMCV